MKTNRTTVKRVPKRGVYDKESIYKILDQDFICHVAFVHEGYPVVIPTLYGRKENDLFLHGAVVSRMMKALESGINISLSVANVQALVLARSAFHHSANYQSVVLMGKGTIVPPEEKDAALKAISDHIIPDRWEEVRPPSPKELQITQVIKVPIEEASAKVRTGPPVDDKKDHELNVWAGILPIEKKYGTPISDELLKEGIEIPQSVINQINSSK